jgi:hypothetical protein
MNRNIVVVIFGLVAMALVGCASSGKSMAPTDTASYRSKPTVQRLIIKSASLTLEVSDPTQVATQIKAIIDRESGLIDSSRDYNDESVSMDTKIPADKLESVVNEISGLGKVVARSINAKDVTEEMVDIDARLKNLYVLRDKFRALLDKAKSVEDVLSIESELSRVQSEIDSIEGRQKSLRNQIAYSKLDIRINKKTRYGPLGYFFKGIYWGVKKLFVFE